MKMNNFVSCCVCGETACGRVKRNKEDEEDDDMELYYCKDHIRGHKADESFFT